MLKSSIMQFATFFANAARETIKANTNLDIQLSQTYQKVTNVKISGDIGSFVSFKGDYDGILIMNFTGEAAVEIVASYLKKMGMPKEDIPVNHTSDDIRNNIGEIVNQIMGKARTQIENRYNIASKANIPAVVPITTPIGLRLEMPNNLEQDCIRVTMSTQQHRFYIELAMEPIELIEMK